MTEQTPTHTEAAHEGAPSRRAPAGFRASFRAAFFGVMRTLASGRNLKVHWVSALMVMIVGMALPLDLATRTALLFAVAIVIFAEILNSALEALVDLFVRDYHRLAMLAKDAAAAGVLVLASVTVLVLAEILWTEWHLVTENLDAVWRSVLFGVPLVVLEGLGLFVVRRGALSMLRLCASIACLAVLVVNARDPVYAGIALLLVVVAFVARHTFPRFTGRGAPVGAKR
jgi:diacylglycerol kinase (ATP)